MLSDVDDIGAIAVEPLLNKVIGADPPCVEANNVANAPPKFMYSESPIFKFSSNTSLSHRCHWIGCIILNYQKIDRLHNRTIRSCIPLS